MITEENQPFASNQIDDASAIAEDNAHGTSSTFEVINIEPNSDPVVSESQTEPLSPESSQQIDLGHQANSGETEEALRQEVETLKAQLDESTKQSDSLKSQYMRIAADFENFRKRTAKEKEELEVKVKCSTITELLSVVDNFERARSQLKPQNDGEMGIHKSYQSVYKQLVDALKRIGVSPMRPEGKDFDPNLHEAVLRQPTDEHPEGTVMEELQRGYFLGDRVLRHALVKVAAAPEPVETLEESPVEPTE
ncbi:Protein grpE [Crinalium epipsammum PCC 9333]|uniref:Protein GrpE n=1 Tax=Crinalium epipsammum PCC 9333 TaxID=1173022 RepID=K9W2R8_9CYAN|nr:nucleotide exchange factor GrpE [Crinalium epipsammum]AFZ14648.1 Protein grpE [Crinalium epipsammum PCC 9333]